MPSIFIQAAVILLREGLEAMLVIAALAAYLTKAGSSHRLHALYGGALGAVGASIVGAWAIATLNAGNHNDLVEACIILLAAALMLYVSGWLMVKQDPRDWQAYLARKADHALAEDRAWTVAALAFLAVVREGAETVLLINALATTAGGWTLSLLSGLGAAAAGLVGAFWFIKRFSQRIPLRVLFVATSAFLFLMALKFIGEAMQEFQEQNLVSFTQMPGGPWLSAVGLNPTVEAVCAQLVVILLALVAYLAVQRNNRRARNGASELTASKS